MLSTYCILNIFTMIINLITFASRLQSKASIRNSHEIILAELEKYFKLNFIERSEISKLTANDFSLIFIATGGVEQMVVQYFELLPKPIVILADGMQNSLASALEISSWLHTRGLKCEILHGERQEIVKRIFALYNNFKAQRKLWGARIGVVGMPSGWLIASNVDYLLVKHRWGINYIDLPLEQVYDYYHQIKDDEVGEDSASLALRALACREASPEDMIKAVRLYKALLWIVQEKHLDALTLGCFKLFELTGTTGCLALSMLNDNGIVAGCEGDHQAVFTMLAAKILTGQESFMGNLSMINIRLNDVVLSHCTVGLNLIDRFILRNHFETEQGIGIQGLFSTGEVTIVKCGGECLDEYYLATGVLTENTNYLHLCRTQARIHLNTPVSYFFHNPLGNHHILLRGNHEMLLDEFFQSNACIRRK